MARFSALLDACALVPITQADLLLRLAEAGLYRPLWNHRILEETVAAIEAVHPQTKASGSARRRVNTMNKVFLDACVDHWEPFVESVDLPDPDDRHVVAAAVRGRADLLVTANLKDFPVEQLGTVRTVSIQRGRSTAAVANQPLIRRTPITRRCPAGRATSRSACPSPTRLPAAPLPSAP
ncbi:PIN domain-containing protein [Helcobacillus sp. ACRRO]|uniref:PIN domain-containing protein n=1 Tax=Helcobacillus sp. ACRRO TaxID=2918202 RepID=UPI001EF499EC|nr:PIN domain-containing protein [Helcobacillus sp. ACRRO]MCG7427443.1 PIN domain-containing protein [Helcobacillus sp. ACRRO]